MKFLSARAGAAQSSSVFNCFGNGGTEKGGTEKGEQIRKTPSKFSNITRAEVFLVYTISAKRSLHPSV